ncbi:MAG: hypothetical protein K6T90_19980 [Leptolyngbyaceae cyanobacterium HOT.MB2.61]|nr:hypothetical protein [Leptolyngbyaceae cyanobacterium HOT.MB2.61]
MDTLPLERKFQYLTLRCGIQYEMGWLEWCEEAMALLRN